MTSMWRSGAGPREDTDGRPLVDANGEQREIVMIETLAKMQDLLADLNPAGVAAVMLVVVPEGDEDTIFVHGGYLLKAYAAAQHATEYYLTKDYTSRG